MWAIAGTVEEVWGSVGYSRHSTRGVEQCGRQQESRRGVGQCGRQQESRRGVEQCGL